MYCLNGGRGNCKVPMRLVFVYTHTITQVLRGFLAHTHTSSAQYTNILRPLQDCTNFKYLGWQRPFKKEEDIGTLFTHKSGTGNLL